MHLYKQLYKKLAYLEPDHIEQIYQAYLLANEAHLGQKRDNGENYIIHPVAVACILADMHLDYQSIMAALLHDVVEDTCVTNETIQNRFGDAVAALVDGVTKLTQIESSSKAETQAQSFRKMVLAMSNDIRVIIIKLADRWHNMQTISGVAPHKRKRIAKETLDIYAPIANRLGIHNIYVELENLSFAALYPRRYHVLREALEQTRGNRKEIMQTLEKELNQCLSKSAITKPKIIGREKHLYGIYKKMCTRHASFSDIMDLYAFRIIVNNIDDCYRALGVVHGLYKPVPGRFKDYIAIPKFNGYQSLHTTLFGPYGIPIEIQIRTQSMEQMANNGIAAHWLYKTGDKVTNTAHVRAQQWVQSLLEMQQNTTNSIEFIENVKIDLFPDEVYVFTPKGSIMELPRGATAVDFAYAVHTDIGNKCIAARIDHKFLPLSTTLYNGQTVAIITSPEAKPNPAWLSFVTTGKARSGIRNFLKDQKHSDSLALGKQLFDKALNDIQLDFKLIPKKILDAFLKESNLQNLEQLYEEIGLGNRLALITAHQLANAAQQPTKPNTESEAKPLLIRGSEGLAINFATCCCPIPGDPIIGFINEGHGIDIHTEDCTNLAKLRKQPEKCLPVDWSENINNDFRVNLNVEMINQRGSLAALAKAISESNSNIFDISMSENNSGYCMVSLRIQVKNISHLERVMRHIANVPAVVGVIRKK